MALDVKFLTGSQADYNALLNGGWLKDTEKTFYCITDNSGNIEKLYLGTQELTNDEMYNVLGVSLDEDGKLQIEGDSNTYTSIIDYIQNKIQDLPTSGALENKANKVTIQSGETVENNIIVFSDTGDLKKQSSVSINNSGTLVAGNGIQVGGNGILVNSGDIQGPSVTGTNYIKTNSGKIISGALATDPNNVYYMPNASDQNKTNSNTLATKEDITTTLNDAIGGEGSSIATKEWVNDTYFDEAELKDELGTFLSDKVQPAINKAITDLGTVIKLIGTVEYNENDIDTQIEEYPEKNSIDITKINENSVTERYPADPGNVILLKKDGEISKEFIWTGTMWEVFGDENSSLDEAKEQIQGGTTATVADCVQAINKIYDGTTETQLNINKIENNVTNVTKQLQWNSFVVYTPSGYSNLSPYKSIYYINDNPEITTITWQMWAESECNPDFEWNGEQSMFIKTEGSKSYKIVSSITDTPLSLSATIQNNTFQIIV